MNSCKVFLLLSVIVSVVFTASNEEQCRTYAGGNVYPDERKLGVEHALHWRVKFKEKLSSKKDEDDLYGEFFSNKIENAHKN